MALHHPLSLVYVTSGLAIGFLVGLTGVGGGSLMTPLLVLLFGFHPATAIGTDLLYASTTKTVGTLMHGLAHSVEWRVVGLMAAGSLPGAVLTIWALSRLGPPSAASAHVLSLALGIALLLTAGALILRERIIALGQRLRLDPSERVRKILTVVLGLYLGVFVTISSVGAGAIGVTALILLYPAMPSVRIVGSDIAHAVPLTLVAGLGHWLIGSVDWNLYLSLVLGSIPGVVLGSLVGTRISEQMLRPVLALILIVVGIRLLG